METISVVSFFVHESVLGGYGCGTPASSSSSNGTQRPLIKTADLPQGTTGGAAGAAGVSSAETSRQGRRVERRKVVDTTRSKGARGGGVGFALLMVVIAVCVYCGVFVCVCKYESM